MSWWRKESNRVVFRVKLPRFPRQQIIRSVWPWCKWRSSSIPGRISCRCNSAVPFQKANTRTGEAFLYWPDPICRDNRHYRTTRWLFKFAWLPFGIEFLRFVVVFLRVMNGVDSHGHEHALLDVKLVVRYVLVAFPLQAVGVVNSTASFDSVPFGGSDPLVYSQNCWWVETLNLVDNLIDVWEVHEHFMTNLSLNKETLFICDSRNWSWILKPLRVVRVSRRSKRVVSAALPGFWPAGKWSMTKWWSSYPDRQRRRWRPVIINPNQLRYNDSSEVKYLKWTWKINLVTWAMMTSSISSLEKDPYSVVSFNKSLIEARAMSTKSSNRFKNKQKL